MTDNTELLAAYWLKSKPTSETDILLVLTNFAAKYAISVDDETLAETAQRLGDQDIGQCIVHLNFLGHPHLNWNFLIDAVSAAETDDHLGTIAAGPAEHLLAHYGSLIDLFESQSRNDPKFARMLTGVWRHRMCDGVWQRLRTIQRSVPDPLLQMIPLDVETGENLSNEDRQTRDKGPFQLQPDGSWKERRNQ